MADVEKEGTTGFEDDDITAEPEDQSTDFMTLVDEDGEEHMFEVLDAIETDLGRYLAMIQHFEDPAQCIENDTELNIMKVFTDDEGEYLEVIDDEGEFNTVSAIFTDRLGEDYEIQYPDEDGEEENDEEDSVEE